MWGEEPLKYCCLWQYKLMQSLQRAECSFKNYTQNKQTKNQIKLDLPCNAVVSVLFTYGREMAQAYKREICTNSQDTQPACVPSG